MKIGLISFDYWGFDQHIIKALQDEGIKAAHINLNNFKYSYPSVFHRIANAFGKIILQRNIKKIRKQEYVLNQLESWDHQDIILVIRPDLLDRKTHQIIKSKTNRYIAYLYDSTKRFPVKHLCNGIFDEIFSFDSKESKNYNFRKISNYIYLPKKELDLKKEYKYSVFIVISKDSRLKILDAISRKLDGLKMNYKFIVKYSKAIKGINPKIEVTPEYIGLDALKQLIEDSKIMMDISRTINTGLSFRIFESLAYQKKLITTNKTVKRYDFYNPNNILIIDPKNPEIPKEFLETNYEPIEDSIYKKYTVQQWVRTVFGLIPKEH